MPNINFLGKGFERQKHRETDATERVTTPRLRVTIRNKINKTR